MSRDSAKSHQNFCNKQDFGFELVSDADEALCGAFDVIREKQLYGRKYIGVDRSTFLLDPDGRVAREWRGVKVPGHAAAVLEAAVLRKETNDAQQADLRPRYQCVDARPDGVVQVRGTRRLPADAGDGRTRQRKKGTSEASRNARQVSRFLNELIASQGVAHVQQPSRWRRRDCSCAVPKARARLRFQTDNFDAGKRFGAVIPDNHILGAILALKEKEPGVPVVFVSKDINLRIKGAIAGIVSEDYENDRALDDFSLLYTGATELPEAAWSIHGKELKSWTDKGRTFYEIARRDEDDWYPNQFLYLPGEEEAEMKVARVTDARVTCRSSTTTATASTRCGASWRATANRTSRSMR